MSYINRDSLPYLVEKLSDANNIKMNGARVGAVVDGLVEKTDTITGAVDMEIENVAGSFKVGTGLDSTDVSSTVEDGFSEIDIKGNTVQNLVLEDNIEAAPSGAMVSAEATSLKLDTVSGNVDMSIKGRTLQNLVYLSNGNKCGNGKFVLPCNAKYSQYDIKAPGLMKRNTDYTFIFNITKNNATAELYFNNTYSTIVPVVKNFNPGEIGVRIFKCNYGEKLPINAHRYSWFEFSTLGEGETEYKGEAEGTLLILEGDYTNTPLEELPYVEGIQGVGDLTTSPEGEVVKVEVKSCGKNLFDFKKIKSENGGIISIISNGIKITRHLSTGDHFIGSFTVEGLKPNSSYTISLKAEYNRTGIQCTKYIYSNRLFGTTLTASSQISQTSTFKTSDTGKAIIGVYSVGSMTKDDWVQLTDIQLEETSTQTPYEPYIEDTLTYTLEEQLHRLSNGVYDEIKDGKLIRRVGKVVLDGSEEWRKWEDVNKPLTSLTIGFATILSDAPSNRNFKVLNSNFKESVINTSDPEITEHPYYATKKESIGGYYANAATTQRLAIGIFKSKLPVESITGFKQWLQANPMTVYYELETPIITELGQPTNLDTYTGTTHITSSNTVLPTMKIDSKGKPYNTLLKPNTDYTVKWSAVNGGANLDLNLGGTIKTVDKNLGSTTIKTSATLADSNLYVAGWGSKVKDVMVAEGSSGVELPYVEGIQGVGNTSKNLFDTSKVASGNLSTSGEELNGSTNDYMIRTDYIEVNSNISYSLKINNQLPNMGTGLGINAYNKDKVIVSSYGSLSNLNSDVKYLRLTLAPTIWDGSVKAIDYVDEMDIQLEEGSAPTPYEPYYDGYKVEVKSTGKNLFNYINVKTENSAGINNDVSILYSDNTFKLTKKTTLPQFVGYRIKTIIGKTYSFGFCGGTSSDGTKGSVTAYSDKPWGNRLATLSNGTSSFLSNTFVATTTTTFVGMYMASKVPIGEIVSYSNVMVWEGVALASYEPYQENTLTYTLEEPLHRLPNGVCDEIKDGKLIRRVGKVVLDGSENWLSLFESQDFARVYADIPSSNCKRNSSAYCSTLPVAVEASSATREGFYNSWENRFLICLRKTKLQSIDINGFKQWLSQNPTAVLYELATPVITELPQPVIRIFKDGHLSFNTTVSPGSTHRVLLNKSAQIEDSVREVQSLDARVDNLESFYDDMILETSHRLNLLDLDFDYIRESEEV